MILTKITVNTKKDGARKALQNMQILHQVLCGIFGTSRKDSDILFSINEEEAETALYVTSSTAMDRKKLPPWMTITLERDYNGILCQIENGHRFGFRLETVPSKKVRENGAKNSRRKALRTSDEREAWLNRKAAQNGFGVLDFVERQGNELTANHSQNNGGTITINSYSYIGALQVTDAEKFKKAVTKGIGPEKAYGLGMLLLSRY